MVLVAAAGWDGQQRTRSMSSCQQKPVQDSCARTQGPLQGPAVCRSCFNSKSAVLDAAHGDCSSCWMGWPAAHSQHAERLAVCSCGILLSGTAHGAAAAQAMSSSACPALDALSQLRVTLSRTSQWLGGARSTFMASLGTKGCCSLGGTNCQHGTCSWLADSC